MYWFVRATFSMCTADATFSICTHTPFRYGRVGLTTLIRFRMPPLFIQRKRIQISASTLAFSNCFRPSTLAMRKRYVFVLRGRLIIEFMTSAFSKLAAFSPVHTNTKGIRFHLGLHLGKPPFSWVKVCVFHRIGVDDQRKRIQKYVFFKRKRISVDGA